MGHVEYSRKSTQNFRPGYPGTPSPESANDKKLSLTGSTWSESLAFFDKHFSDKLVLNRVERLSSLKHAIANTVDLAITAALDNNVHLLPPDALLSSRQRDGLVENLELTMADEKAVANFYDKITAIHTARV